MDNLKLTIPSRLEGQHILVETNPGKLKHWLMSLPYADLSKTLPEISRSISSLNRTSLNYKKRAELVTLFDETYAQIHNHFRPATKHFGRNMAIDKKLLEQLHNLTREMAYAHKVIINDSQEKRIFFGKNKVKIHAMAQAIFYLGLMLIEQYESYASVPIYLWREINAIYAHANGQNEDKVDIGETYNKCLNSIEKNYIRNCLIALADPYHLANGEHWYVFQYLQVNSDFTRISESADDFSKSNCFLMDFSSEHKPNFVTEELNEGQQPKLRLLITDKLVAQTRFDHSHVVNKDRSEIEGFPPGISGTVAAYLLEHLQGHWSQRIERHAKRYPIVTRVDVVWGIRSSVEILEMSKNQKKSALPVDQVFQISKLEKIEHLTWDAINVSTGGIGLCSRHFMLNHIHLGDLTLVREYMDGKPAPHWRLGVCKWHTGDKINGTILGIQYIEGQYHPVRLVLHQGRNEKGGQTGLVISNAMVNGHNEPTIIIERENFHSDKVYAMLGYEQPVEIRLRARVSVTPRVERFFYQSSELRDELREEIQDGLIEVEHLPWTSIPHEHGNIYDELTIDPEKIKHQITLDDIKLRGK